MLMLACVEAALTGVANSRVVSMLMAGRILTNRNIVRRVGFVCLLIRLGSKIEDLSVSRYRSQGALGHKETDKRCTCYFDLVFRRRGSLVEFVFPSGPLGLGWTYLRGGVRRLAVFHAYPWPIR